MAFACNSSGVMTILAGKNDKSVVKIISSEDHPICYEEVNGETVDPFKIDADTLEGKSVQDIVKLVPNPDLSNVDAKTLSGKTLDEIVASAAESSVPDGKYGYKIVLTNSDGSPASNAKIAGFEDVASEVFTDDSGVALVHSTSGKVVCVIHYGDKYYLRMFKNSRMGSLGVFSINLTDIADPETVENFKIGEVVSVCNRDWVIAHKTNTEIILARTVIEVLTEGLASSLYDNSPIANAAISYESTIENESLNHEMIMKGIVVTDSHAGVQCKIYVPDIYDVSTTYTYFADSAENRICKYNGSAYAWWLREMGKNTSYTSIVDNQGSVGNNYYVENDAKEGFRPFMRLKIA